MDPELAAMVPLLPRLDLADVAASRALLTDGASAMGELGDRSWEQTVTVSDRLVPGPQGAPDVAVRIYDPAGPRPRAGLVYFHGGAFVLGEIELFDNTCGGYAASGDLVVVSVGYRLAPEHPFPAGAEDCYAALVWTAANAAELGIDSSRIAVGGASAGGGLAAATALMARDRSGPHVAFQLLNYPVLDDRMETPSVRAFVDTPLWDSRNTRLMWELYLGADRGEAPVYAAPARASDLTGLPPAYVLTCELDPLRDEGIGYALRLLQAGVPVELHNVGGTFHGFDAFPAAVSRAAAAEQVGALRRALGQPAGAGD